MKTSRFGWSRGPLFGVGLWWDYDLTLGAVWTWKHLRKRGRFFGLTIGQCCIGITWFRKEG